MRISKKTTELVNVSARILVFLLRLKLVQSAAKKTALSECGECADPDECKAIADLGVDMLAAGIGNIHGKYPANWPGLKL